MAQREPEESSRKARQSMGRFQSGSRRPTPPLRDLGQIAPHLENLGSTGHMAQNSKRLKELLEEAYELPFDERNGFVDERCADDPSMRAELHSLLESLEGGEGFLAEPAVLPQTFADTDGQAADPDETLASRRETAQRDPESIGGFRIQRLIGAGGMGAVYLAEREDPSFEQRVAIKVIRDTKLQGDAVERFVQERKILARLEHPSIARLLDGGTTDDGLPYLVMEYVEGRPLTKYCDENALNIEQRISIFQDVCHAVHHAHRNLIVHRDLKPNNILVAPRMMASLRSSFSISASREFWNKAVSSPH